MMVLRLVSILRWSLSPSIYVFLCLLRTLNACLREVDLFFARLNENGIFWHHGLPWISLPLHAEFGLRGAFQKSFLNFFPS